MWGFFFSFLVYQVQSILRLNIFLSFLLNPTLKIALAP